MGQDGRGRPAAPGVRRQRAAGGGRVRDAHAGQRQHQRPGHNDRGEGGRHDQGEMAQDQMMHADIVVGRHADGRMTFGTDRGGSPVLVTLTFLRPAVIALFVCVCEYFTISVNV